MPTVHQNAPNAVGRPAECVMALFGIGVAFAILYISLDLLLDGWLSRGAGGALSAAASPVPDIPRPRPAPEADRDLA